MDKYAMEVHSVSNLIGWVDNRLIKEFKTTYNYEKGNDVVITELRSYAVQLYSEAGTLTDYPNKGSNVDVKV